MWITMSYCVHALRYADLLVTVVPQGFRMCCPQSNFVSGVMQLILADNAPVRSMMCARLLCKLSSVAHTIQEQVRPCSMCSPSLCQAI